MNDTREHAAGFHVFVVVAAILLSGLCSQAAHCAEPRLVAHWPLAEDASDISGNEHHGKVHGVAFERAPTGRPGMAARFDGCDDFIEIADGQWLEAGIGDFSFCAWVHTAEALDDVLGDVASKFDPQTRTGWTLTIQHNVGGTTSQANYRDVSFGIDCDHLDAQWTDCGRPGEAVLIYSMAVMDNQLYVGTCEAGKEQAGRVLRYAGGKEWIDCGAPDRANAISALAVHEGKLYAAASKYRLRGSSLAESENPHVGGKIYRYEGDNRWQRVGTLPGVEAISSMAVFRGKLYASSMYRPAGLYRYDGETSWTACSTPDGRRVEALSVYNGAMYAGGYDEGAVYRYDGSEWTHGGRLGENTQTYGFAVYRGELYVGTWPSGRVYRYADEKEWEDVGRLGEELEVMGMAVYNGGLYSGTLPLAQVYRYDAPQRWLLTGRVDHTPDVRYRRAWTMAVFDGKLFVGTLPSGRVWSLEAGKSATIDRPLPAGWAHLAAVKDGRHLRLYLNGHLAASSAPFDPAAYNLDNDQPLRIGFGPQDYFHGYLQDVRLYDGALTANAISTLARRNE